MHGRSSLNWWCEQTGTYEILSQDLVDRLADYIASRPYMRTNHSMIRPAVVEVGAGDGSLSYFLGRSLNARHPALAAKLDLVASDLEPY